VRRHAKAQSAGSSTADGDSRGLFGIAGLCLLVFAAFLGSGAPPAAAAECPSEALRLSQSSNVNPTTGQTYDAGLPECRALEKVTPDYKQSSNLDTGTSNFPMASDGSAISWRMAGQVEGAGSATGLAYYMAHRSATGWTMSNVTVPFSLIAGLGSFNTPKYASDLSRTVWCGKADESAGLAQEQIDPIRCAVGDSSGQWMTTSLFKPVDAYASTSLITGASTSPALRGASADLSHFVFSTGIRYLAADTANSTVATLYEVVTPPFSNPTLRIVNLDNSGALIGPATAPVLGGSPSASQAVSADGSRIFFTTTPAGGVATLYARTSGATTTTVSNPSPAECTTCDPTAKAASYVGASDDGQRVFFIGSQQLLNADTDTGANCTATVTAGCDLYEYDFEAPVGHHLVQASGGGAGDLTPGSGAEVQGLVQISSDATHVYFFAKGVLTTVPNAGGQIASTGASNLYVFERDAEFPAGRTRFVATMPAGESSALVGANSAAQTTPDGRYLVFGTAAQLIATGPEADTDSATDVYRYDSKTGELRRVSIGEPGYPASNNGNTTGMNAIVQHAGGLVSQNGPNLGPAGSRSRRAAISDDGSSIVFATAEKLQADDSNGGTGASVCVEPTNSSRVGCDVYLWHEGTVRMISPSSPPSSEGSAIPLEAGISASGADIFFTSPGRLVPADIDANGDVYDARVGGGFPSPAPAPACEGSESCHGAPLTAPAGGPAGTSSFSGSGNQAPASKHKHRKKKHRKHTTPRHG
jgi:hypothetical protein